LRATIDGALPTMIDEVLISDLKIDASRQSRAVAAAAVKRHLKGGKCRWKRACLLCQPPE
jgi:hypothetical protein